MNKPHEQSLLPPSKRPSMIQITSWEEEEDVYWDNQKHEEFVRIYYKNRGGHPARQPISKRQFMTYCQMRPTVGELADCFMVSADAIESFCQKAFTEIDFTSMPDLIGKLGHKYKFNLRRFLWSHAEKSASMAIFLAKNYLEMSENPGPGAENIQIETVNYNIAKGKDIGLWNEAKRQQKKIASAPRQPSP